MIKARGHGTAGRVAPTRRKAARPFRMLREGLRAGEDVRGGEEGGGVVPCVTLRGCFAI